MSTALCSRNQIDVALEHALAGRADIDFEHEPIGHDDHGQGVYLRDIWPTQAEVSDAITSSITPEMFASGYGDVFEGTAEWQEVPVTPGDLFAWNPESTYIHQPPFFETLDLHAEPKIPGAIHGARPLVIVGDSVTTDHISPAGDIAENSPAGSADDAGGEGIPLTGTSGRRVSRPHAT